VRRLIDGVVFGSREFADDWFRRHRSFFKGTSATKYKSGARYIGDGWRFLYTLRQLDQEKHKPEPAPADLGD
jgi:hypothetical protein